MSMKNLVRGRMGTDSTQVLRRIFECVRIFRRRAYEIERNSFIAVNKGMFVSCLEAMPTRRHCLILIAEISVW